MNWRTIKLGEVIKHRKCIITIDNDAEYKLCRVQLHRKGVVLRDVVQGSMIKTKKQQICKSGDFLVAEMDAKFGGYGFVPEELNGAIVSSHYYLFELNTNKIRPKYLEVISKLLILQDQIKAIGSTNYSSIRPASVLDWEIPITEIENQVQIEKLFENATENGNKLSTELTHQLDLVKQLRQAFLREAMQGKLTEAWRASHPELISGPNSARQLLAKIKTEKDKLIKNGKLRSQKPLPPIKEDEIPFEIPKSWEWCRLGEICITNGRIGWKGLTASEYTKSGPLFVSVHSLNYGDYVDYTQAFHISQERYNESPEIMLQNEDILICKDGAGIGKLGIVQNLNEQATVNSSLLLIRKLIGLDSKYIYYFLLSSHFQKIVNSRIMGATTPHLYQRDLVGFLLALPPVQEQQLIVAKLDELMQYCDQLEGSIKTSQRQNEMLLQQVLREALEPKFKTESKVIDLKTRRCNSSEKAILAGHIINLTNSEDFGRVKFQKLLYLIEHLCKLDLNSYYQRKVAGPHDGELLSEIESTLEHHRFYKIRQSNERNHRVSYTALSYASELEDLYKENFISESSELDELLSKFKNSTWEQCEIVATLYAVWNNRIIRQEQITDELLKQDFLNWDKKKIKYQDRLEGALEWMKRKMIIPDGWGKIIE